MPIRMPTWRHITRSGLNTAQGRCRGAILWPRRRSSGLLIASLSTRAASLEGLARILPQEREIIPSRLPSRDGRMKRVRVILCIYSKVMLNMLKQRTTTHQTLSFHTLRRSSGRVPRKSGVPLLLAQAFLAQRKQNITFANTTPLVMSLGNLRASIQC